MSEEKNAAFNAQIEKYDRWFVGEIIGFILGISDILLALLSGKELVEPLFNIAYASIGFALAARAWTGTMLLATLIGIAALWFIAKIMREHGRASRWRLICGIVIGFLLAKVAIFVLIDLAFFLGAILTLPFIYGACLLAVAISRWNADTDFLGWFERFLSSEGDKTPTLRESGSIARGGLVIVIGLWLLVPVAPAIIGALPSPPASPSTGWGALEDSYSVSEVVIHYDSFPELAAQWAAPDEDPANWKVYVFAPNIAATGEDNLTVGIAVFLHGYQGEDVAVYRDTLATLAASGLLTFYPQYISDYDTSLTEGHTPEYLNSTSDHPQHPVRYDMAWQRFEQASRMVGVDWGDGAAPAGDSTAKGDVWDALGESTIVDRQHLWIGGHSMGVGTTFHVLSELLERGWGSQTLVVGLEAPWVSSSDPEWGGDMSMLPDHAVVQIAEYETDNRVHQCIGRFGHNRMATRDNTVPMPDGQVLHLFVPTDFHGFPRLIASHYLQATILRDALADQAYYPRLEAQATYVAAGAAEDTEQQQAAWEYLSGENGEMLDLGEWSDGVAVKPIRILDSPLDEPLTDGTDCLNL